MKNLQVKTEKKNGEISHRYSPPDNRALILNGIKREQFEQSFGDQG